MSAFVCEPQETFSFVPTADEIYREMQAHDRVNIYGIQFSPEDQSIQEEQSQILFEILKCLMQSPTLSLVIESTR